MRFRTVLLALTSICCSAPALANPFDDCVLENMRGVTADLAARSIKVSCLRKTSVEIPAEALAKVKATANYGVFDGKNTGFLMEVNNQSDYVLTEITLTFRVDKMPEQIVRTDDFRKPQPAGVLYAGPPLDPTYTMQIKPFVASSFFIPMQTNIPFDAKKRNGNGFAWVIVSMRGIPPK